MKIVVANPNGHLPPKGRIQLQGSKNAMLIHLVLPLMTTEPCFIENAPRIGDVDTNLAILRSLGARVVWQGDHSLKIECTTLKNSSLAVETARLTTGSKFLIPILTNRFGDYVTGPSGGDRIGDRGFLSYAESLKPFGIGFELLEKGQFRFFKTGTPVSDWKLPFPSFGLTVNAILCAVSGSFAVRLSNTCLEPEIDNAIDLLRLMGAPIQRKGRVIEVGKSSALHGVRFRNLSDRNAAVTYAVMGAITGGGITIDNYDDVKMEAFYHSLHSIGVRFTVSDRTLSIAPQEKSFQPVHIAASLYPEFHSDWQALVAPLLATIPGESVIEEHLFPDRLRYWDELAKMGAVFDYDDSFPSRFDSPVPHAVRIQGPVKLHGSHVLARDLRGGAALVIASLVAKGVTVIENAQEIFRGYEDLPGRLRDLGISVEIIEKQAPLD